MYGLGVVTCPFFFFFFFFKVFFWFFFFISGFGFYGLYNLLLALLLTLAEVGLVDGLARVENAIKLLHKPLHRLLASNTVRGTNAATALLTLGNATTGAAHNHVKVHAVDANARVVFQTQVNVLVNAKAKVARIRKVFLPELILLDL